MLFSFQKSDDPVECSSTGRRKRKSRQDLSYSVFFNDDEVEMQNYLKKKDTNRFVTSVIWYDVSLKFQIIGIYMLHHNTAYMFQTVISVSPTNKYM